MTHIKLTNILNEIKREQKRTIKEGLNQFKIHVLGSVTVSEIINSNGLPDEQTLALQEFFKYYNKGIVPILNETTIKRIDKHVLNLSDSNILSEGFFDWMKKVGSKAKEWLQSGWENVKKVWGNFKDAVSVVIENVKIGLKKLAAAAWDKVKGLASSMKKSLNQNTEKAKAHLEQHDASSISKEWNGVTSALKYLGTFSKKLVTGENWAFKVESGNVSPSGNSVAEHKFIFDKSLVEGLLNVNLITEGMHLEDLLNKDKYPTLHKILKYALKVISWVFNPINTAMKYLAKFLIGGWTKDGKSGILYIINKTAELLGGPKSIAYPILGFLCMELTESVLSSTNLYTHGKMLGSLNVGVEAIDSLGINVWETLHHLIELVPGLSTVVFWAEVICIIYAIANFIINVFPEIVKKINPNINLAH